MVGSPSISNEAGLAGLNDGLDKRLDPIGYDFGDYFIDGVAEANRPISSIIHKRLQNS